MSPAARSRSLICFYLSVESLILISILNLSAYTYRTIFSTKSPSHDMWVCPSRIRSDSGNGMAVIEIISQAINLTPVLLATDFDKVIMWKNCRKKLIGVKVIHWHNMTPSLSAFEIFLFLTQYSLTFLFTKQ